MRFLSKIFIILLTISKVNLLDPLPSVNDPSGYINDPNTLTLEDATAETGNSENMSIVRFYLYTSNDRESTNHFIDPKHPTKLIQAKDKIFFLIHGWLQSPETTPWFRPLTKFLLKKIPDSYVVQTDWSKYTGGNYSSAAYATEGVGRTIGNFIYKLVKNFDVPSMNIVLIGHSLGGQITGWTGKTYFGRSRSKLPRFIALDPSGPLFNSFPNEKKLNKNDAEVVMVVHTDKTKLGYPHSCGTIDFFPNGGTNQTGCSSAEDSNLCSHNMAYKLFLEAVEFPQFFMAKKCSNYHDFKTNHCENEEVSLGDLETSQTGNFYLVTSDRPLLFDIHE